MKLMTSLSVIILFCLAASIYAAGTTPTVPAPQDSRIAARAWASQEATQIWNGYVGYTLQTTTGSQENHNLNFVAKDYGQPAVTKIFILTHTFPDGTTEVLWNNPNQPLEVIPYPTNGTPIYLYTHIYGYDANGNGTSYGDYSSQSWTPRMPFVYQMRPGSRPVFIPFSLNGLNPDEVRLLVEEWQGGQFDYNQLDGGFTFWMQPTETLHYTIVDGHGNIIIPRTELQFGNLIDLPRKGSSINMDFQSVTMVKFSVESFFQKESRYDSIVQLDNIWRQASIFTIDCGETQQSMLWMGFGNFAGRVKVELVNADGSWRELISMDWNQPNRWYNGISIPTQGIKGVVISFIKTDDPVTLPIGWPWNSSIFYVTIGRQSTPVGGGGGGGLG